MVRGLPPLLPEPKRAQRLPGVLRLRDRLPIVLQEGSADDAFASALALRDAVETRCGIRLAVETHGRGEGLSPRIGLLREDGEGESYQLRVAPEGAELSGAGPAGLRLAVETLAQLVDARGRIPCCEIEDAPDLPLRGVMLDVSRGKVPTLDTLEGNRRLLRTREAQRADALRRAHLPLPPPPADRRRKRRPSTRRPCASSTPTQPRVTCSSSPRCSRWDTWTTC